MSDQETIDKIRHDFIANVSHELRTPLTVFQGYCETLLSEAENHPWQPILQQMHNQSRRMNHLVEDLLLLAELESSNPEKITKTIVVAKLLPAIIEEARTINPTHHFSSDIDGDLCITGCPNELRSAFTNLIINAVHYTPDNGSIHISWRVQNQNAVFSVKDSGIGIAPEHIARLTERFYRVDKGRSRHSGGTGLGLAIVKHVLLRHHARLDIQSVEHEGSVFSCHFSEVLS